MGKCLTLIHEQGFSAAGSVSGVTIERTGGIHQNDVIREGLQPIAKLVIPPSVPGDYLELGCKLL